MSFPLAGLTVTAGDGCPAAAAAELLVRLGAGKVHDASADPAGLALGPEGTHGARLTPLDQELGPAAAAGLPDGALGLALARTLATGALAASLLGREVEVDALSVAVQMQLPAVMAAAYGSDWWPSPPAPRPAPGGGWYNAELGGPDNADAFGRLMATVPPDADGSAVAAAAQEWRLPVCDYREPAATPPWREAEMPAAGPVGASGAAAGGPDASAGPAGLDGLRVLDLTSMWAGPLASWLLGRLGADVVKIEPLSRPDGFRAAYGRGVWPGGRARREDGSESAVFNALNTGKRSLSVEAPAEADRLRQLVDSAELVVDSFAPRVMAQLGLRGADEVAAEWRAAGLVGTGLVGTGTESPSSPLLLSMPAFPSGPLREWVAYGTGVHALSGLGFHPTDGGAPYRSPAVTYPDPLSGLLAVVIGLAALRGGGRGAVGRRYEISLAGSVESLLGRRRVLRPPDPRTGATLLAAAIESSAVSPVADGAGTHWYPVGPFRFAGAPPLRPAPPRPEASSTGAPPWTR